MQRAALFSGGDAQMAAGDLGELLVPYMPTIRVPKSGDRVYKTECAFSYDSPVSAAKPPPAASTPPSPPPTCALRQTRPSCRPFPAAPSPRAAVSPSAFQNLPPSLPRPARPPPPAVEPGLPSPSPPAAASRQRCSCACLFIFFPPSGGLKWLLRREGFAVLVGKTSRPAGKRAAAARGLPAPPVFPHTLRQQRGAAPGLLLCALWLPGASRFAFLLPRCSVSFLKSSAKASKVKAGPENQCESPPETLSLPGFQLCYWTSTNLRCFPTSSLSLLLNECSMYSKLFMV